MLTIATMSPMISPMSHVASNTILLAKSKGKVIKTTSTENNLYNDVISINNVWNYPVLNIGFNKNNTFKILNGVYYLNPYYTGDNSLTINITNANGKVIYTQNFAGGSYPYTEVNKALSNKIFNYGDIISITSRSNANFDVDGVKSKSQINYVITQNGLKELNTNSIQNLKAYYNGSNTIVTGNTVTSSLITLWVGSKSYSTMSGSSGTFKATLPNTVNQCFRRKEAIL